MFRSWKDDGGGGGRGRGCCRELGGNFLTGSRRRGEATEARPQLCCAAGTCGDLGPVHVRTRLPQPRIEASSQTLVDCVSPTSSRLANSQRAFSGAHRRKWSVDVCLERGSRARCKVRGH